MTSPGPGDETARAVDPASAWQEVGHRLRAYVASRVAPADADDIVQSVMVKLLERRHDIDAASVRAWLFTVTRNAVAEYYRHKRPSVDLGEVGDVSKEASFDPEDLTIGALTDCLEPMLGTLSEADAELLRRVDLEGDSQIELAARLGVPVSTLKSRVQRARTKLRSAFDACCSITLDRNGAPVEMTPGNACTPSPPKCSH